MVDLLLTLNCESSENFNFLDKNTLKNRKISSVMAKFNQCSIKREWYGFRFEGNSGFSEKVFLFLIQYFLWVYYQSFDVVRRDIRM